MLLITISKVLKTKETREAWVDALASEQNALHTVLLAMQEELSNPINTAAIFAGRLDY